MYRSHSVRKISGMYLLISLCDSMTGVCKALKALRHSMAFCVLAWFLIVFSGRNCQPCLQRRKFQCAPACCGMLQPPPPPRLSTKKQGANFSVLQHAAACFNPTPPCLQRKQGANFSVPQHAAAYFKTPTNRPPKQVLRYSAACFNRW